MNTKQKLLMSLIALGLASVPAISQEDRSPHKGPRGDRPHPRQDGTRHFEGQPPHREGRRQFEGQPPHREGRRHFEGQPPHRQGQRPPAPPLLAALDENRDGVIDAHEIDNATAALRSLDKDQDGQLTRIELRPQRPHQQRFQPRPGFRKHRLDRHDRGPRSDAPERRRGPGRNRPPGDGPSRR